AITRILDLPSSVNAVAWHQESGLMACAVGAGLLDTPTDGSAIYVWSVPALDGARHEERSAAQAIRQVRETFAQAGQLGLGTWFNLFDQYARRRCLAVCRALLIEIRDDAYALSPLEMAYVDSREGALVMLEGADHQIGGRLDAAEECYRRSEEL